MGEVAVREPHVPVLGGDGEPPVRFVVLRPLALGRRDRRAVARAVVGPAHGQPSVVRPRLALHPHRHAPVDAAQGTQEHVVRVGVGRWPAVGERALVVVVPRADQQHVADDHPARARAPRRLEHHRARQVASAGRHGGVGGREREAARVAVEDRAEDRRAVEARQAHPLDGAARRDQRADLAVRQERVGADRRERAAAERDVVDDVAHLAHLRCAATRGPARGWRRPRRDPGNRPRTWAAVPAAPARRARSGRRCAIVPRPRRRG